MILHCSAAFCAVNLCRKVKNILQRSNCSSQRPVSACVRQVVPGSYIESRGSLGTLHKHSNLWFICRPMLLLSSTPAVSPAGVIQCVCRGHRTAAFKGSVFFSSLTGCLSPGVLIVLEVCSSLNSSIRAEKRNREKLSLKGAIFCSMSTLALSLLTSLGCGDIMQSRITRSEASLPIQGKNNLCLFG